jgi:hypothetical protein
MLVSDKGEWKYESEEQGFAKYFLRPEPTYCFFRLIAFCTVFLCFLDPTRRLPRWNAHTVCIECFNESLGEKKKRQIRETDNFSGKPRAKRISLRHMLSMDNDVKVDLV